MSRTATDLIGAAYSDNGGHDFGDLWGGVEKLVDAQLDEIVRLKAEVESLKNEVDTTTDAETILQGLLDTARAGSAALRGQLAKIKLLLQQCAFVCRGMLTDGNPGYEEAMSVLAPLVRQRDEARARALEDCKKLIMGGRFLHDEAPTRKFAIEVCAAIDRALLPAPVERVECDTCGDTPTVYSTVGDTCECAASRDQSCPGHYVRKP